MNLYTIGHSNHPIEKFIQLLADNGIDTLVDVRSAPYSRFNPQFNKNALQQSLAQHKIEYVHVGAKLGGRPTDPSCYIHHVIPAKSSDYLHEVNYAEVMKRPWFHEGIQSLVELAGHSTTAIMCSEEDPTRCHRHHLIARYLMNEHPEITILHIRKDGNVIDAKSIHTLPDKPGAEQLTF